MAYFVSFETPAFKVVIHRGECPLCADGHYRPDDTYLSWSPAFETYRAAKRHVEVYFSFFPDIRDCPICNPAASGNVP